MECIDYEKQATDFLAAHNITFSVVLVGSDCPAFCEDGQQLKAMKEVDKYPRKSHIHGKHYRCSFKRLLSSNAEGKPVARRPTEFITDFWNSYADEEYNMAFHNQGNSSYALLQKYKKEIAIRRRARMSPPMRGRGTVVKLPTPYDILTCCTKSDPGTFADFCCEYGYDSGIKARKIYDAVVAEWQSVNRFFTAEELTQMWEIQ